MNETSWYADDMAAVKAAHPTAMCFRREFGASAGGLRRDTFVISACGVELHQADVAEGEGGAWKLARMALEARRAASAAADRRKRWRWSAALGIPLVIVMLGMDFNGDGRNTLSDLVHAKPFLSFGTPRVLTFAERRIRDGEQDISCWRRLQDDDSLGPVHCGKQVEGKARY